MIENKLENKLEIMPKLRGGGSVIQKFAVVDKRGGRVNNGQKLFDVICEHCHNNHKFSNFQIYTKLKLHCIKY